MRFLNTSDTKDRAAKQHRLAILRHRLDQLTAPKFDRDDVEFLLTELVAYQTHVEYLLSTDNEGRDMLRAMRDNLRDAEIEIGRLRTELKITQGSADNYRRALEAELRGKGNDQVRVHRPPVLRPAGASVIPVVSEFTIKEFEKRVARERKTVADILGDAINRHKPLRMMECCPNCGGRHAEGGLCIDEQGMTGCPVCGERHPPDGPCV